MQLYNVKQEKHVLIMQEDNRNQSVFQLKLDDSVMSSSLLKL